MTPSIRLGLGAVVLAAAAVAGGCAGRDRPAPGISPSAAGPVAVGGAPTQIGGAPSLSVDRDRDLASERAAQAIDAEIERTAALPPAERFPAQARLEGRLERFLADVEGTRLENKALYLLADWRFSHRPGARLRAVDDLLDRLERCSSPAFKAAGRGLRVRVRLHQGRLAEARSLAQALVREIPEAQPLIALAEFHARVGTAPGMLTGTPIGEPFDPAAAGWLLYLFIPGSDEVSLYLVRQWQEACRAAKATLVVVTADGIPLASARSLREAGAGAVLWASPADGGDLKAWVEAWSLPKLPVAALVSPGPARRIMAVEPRPAELRELLGR